MNFSDPKTNILQLGLREGMKVGDLGAGSGHYALYAAAAVGNSGRVYAVDVQEDILKHIRERAREHGVRNIETLWGDIERPGGSGIRDGVLDAVILSNVLFQVSHKGGLVAEVKRILKPSGRVLVVDWAGAYGGMGPSAHLVVTPRDAETLFATAGFRKGKEFKAGPHHYGIIFEL